MRLCIIEIANVAIIAADKAKFSRIIITFEGRNQL